MNIELKIIITSVLLWVVTHFAAHPTTDFASWGERKFKGYGVFVMVIAAIYVVPIIAATISFIWKQ